MEEELEEESPELSDISESAFELIELIKNSIDDYFNDEYEVIKFNVNFLESNGFAYQTKIDYMKLNRFISTAYNTIEANDVQVIDGLLSKFYKDIIFLNHFYKNFLEKAKDIQSIFRYNFLKPHQGTAALYALLSEKEEKKTGKKEKDPSEDELNAFEEYMKEEFRHEFLKEYEIYSENLREIINTKTYYFDKLLWAEARKSNAINEFFKKSKRVDAEFSDELSTKIFIQQYLHTIDMSHTKDVKWHQYLHNVLTMMD
ncbi:MAG: hypothetical protein PHR87_02245 [Sulfurospirillaceae bacterium]|nr:hypothetical protein [Sulfurospirillaceae bacterium]